jgi:hypothetical protein
MQKSPAVRGFLLTMIHDVVNVWTLLKINPFISSNNRDISITIPVFPTERWGFFCGKGHKLAH